MPDSENTNCELYKSDYSYRKTTLACFAEEKHAITTRYTIDELEVRVTEGNSSTCRVWSALNILPFLPPNRHACGVDRKL